VPLALEAGIAATAVVHEPGGAGVFGSELLQLELDGIDNP
jgi:hypothetical protein